jgi:hypothetical protein
MIDKKTVFVLGAGASCPYGYPSGSRLRERVCLSQGFWQDYNARGIVDQIMDPTEKIRRLPEIKEFMEVFNKSVIKSIDKFMANNPKLAKIGKHIIAFEVLRAEGKSLFGEEAKLEKDTLAYAQNPPIGLLSKTLFQGDDWYSFLYNRLIEGQNGPNTFPDFSNGNLAFITFNYDRSLEQFLYEALHNSFTEVQEDEIVKSLKQLRILHVYGQVAFLKWQNPKDYIDYKLPISELLLQRVAKNIRTIYEEKQNPELIEAQNLLKQAKEIFFLGFGYAQENMEVLELPKLIPPECEVYGTAFNMIDKEIDRLRAKLHGGRTRDQDNYLDSTATQIDASDCLMLLRKYLR